MYKMVISVPYKHPEQEKRASSILDDNFYSNKTAKAHIRPKIDRNNLLEAMKSLQSLQNMPM